MAKKYVAHTIKNTEGMFIQCRDTVGQVLAGLSKTRNDEVKQFQVDGKDAKVISDDVIDLEGSKTGEGERVTILEINYV